MTSVVAAKREIRKQMASLLKQITEDQVRHKSDVIFAKLRNAESYKQAKRVSVYLNTNHEVSTVQILEELFSRPSDASVVCFVPRFDVNKSEMEMVKLLSMQDYHSLPSVKWNIKQPLLDDNRESVFDGAALDLVIVPGVAFTAEGLRLGHGKGYYDQFLTKHRSTYGHLPATVALAFEEQLVNEVPTTENDIPVDVVITDRKLS